MFGLLGKTLSHSLSPEIHSYFGNYEYKLFCREQEELDEFFADPGIEAFNVTIPYKIEAFGRCDVLSNTAKEIGSVNTVIKKKNILYGYNTDLYGFETAVGKTGVSFTGKKVLILGSGGASKTVMTYCCKAGVREALIISRSGKNSYNNINIHSDADIIVNTTPVGMYPGNGASPVDLEIFDRPEYVFDLIYNPFRTRLLLDAEKLGIPSVNGLYMLISQGLKSAELFTGREIDNSLIEKAYLEIKNKMMNIVLIGMPGCGKTSAGRELARITGREIVDIDDEIVKAEGKSIPEIFSVSGENYFRDSETKETEKISKRTGLVISTGGGTVLREQNRDYLRQNGIIIYLKRNIEELTGEGRPLSSSREKIMKLYEERHGIYESLADYTVDVSEDINTTVRRILNCVSL